jgi:integrase
MVMCMTRRRSAHGRPNPTRRADSRFVLPVELPIGPDGRRRRKYVYGRTEEEVVKKAASIEADLHSAGDLPSENQTLARWLTWWLDHVVATSVKPKTADFYRMMCRRYIQPVIGRIRLGNLTPAHVKQVSEHITASGLSASTALGAHRVLHRALKVAVQYGASPRNPADMVDAPKNTKKTRQPLTANQARQLLTYAASGEPIWAVLWSLYLLAGLRRGEALGLTWDNVRSDMLIIQWQLQHLTWEHGCPVTSKGEPSCGRKRGANCPDRIVRHPEDYEAIHLETSLWLTRPKTLTSFRPIPLAPQLAQILAQWRRVHPPTGNAIDLLFTTPDGRPIDPDLVTKTWAAHLAALGIPHTPLHAARHTAATLLMDLGVPEQTRIAVMGHSSAVTTRGYTHITDPLMADATSKLGSLVLPDGLAITQHKE